MHLKPAATTFWAPPSKRRLGSSVPSSRKGVGKVWEGHCHRSPGLVDLVHQMP